MATNNLPEQRPVEKSPTGIEGVDEVTYGGLPRGRMTLVMGVPGSGKTVFALQTLVNAAERGEKGIFVAFEEKSAQLVRNGAAFGWDTEKAFDQNIYVIDARLFPGVIKAGEFDTTGLLASLEAKLKEMGATFIVFDSIDILLTLLDDPIDQRRELYRLIDWLDDQNMTGIVTARIEETEVGSPRHYGFLQFMASCTMLLHYRIEEKVAHRAFRVVKYRGSNFAQNEFPLVIGDRGLEVASLGTTTADIEYQVSQERITTGIDRLNKMLGGGYYRGSTVVVSGAPGTAKSTLCGLFIEETCKRGENTLYVSFDESGEEIVRNLASVSIDLQTQLDSGRLRMYSGRSQARSAEEYLMIFRRLVEEQKPKCMVVDPVSAMIKAGGLSSASNVATRLIHFTKSRGITLMMSSLLEGAHPETEGTPVEISTLADTWIHLSYMAHAGERNRAITIIKSRGTRHSNQVRELVLSDDGLTLADVYTAGGEVLMGTLRAEKEAGEVYERERVRSEVEYRKKEMEYAESEIKARSEALKRELDMKREELKLLEKEHQRREDEWQRRHESRYQMRKGDTPAGPKPISPDME